MRRVHRQMSISFFRITKQEFNFAIGVGGVLQFAALQLQCRPVLRLTPYTDNCHSVKCAAQDRR